ncbi:hypothetical protein [Streptomyces syringium]|uniref:hypothetical protein n=1 Tax=Streptomyces syringium TaxID=76729 RepID=UPI0037D5183A
MTHPAPYTFDPSNLTQAVDEARDRVHRAEARMARVACTLIAVSVRDILTDYDPDPAAPFDAQTFRLTVNQHQRVSTDGTYWTASGEERRITDHLDLCGVAEWTTELDHSNRAVWEPLCQYEGKEGDSTHYRLDLAQAARLPAEVNQSARLVEIRDRLAAATRAPWYAEEIVYTRGGGIVSSGDPDAVHTDFLVTDADDCRVAEIALSLDGLDDTATTAEAIAASRANAELIAWAPQDLRFLMAYLDHACGGEDAEAMHLRGYCARCGTALYTSAMSETPAAWDGNTRCKGSPITSNVFPLHHYLRH